MKRFTYTLTTLVFLLALVFDPTIENPYSLPKFLILQVGVVVFFMLFLLSDLKIKLNGVVIIGGVFILWLGLSTWFALHFPSALLGESGGYHGFITFLIYIGLMILISQAPIDVDTVLKGLVVCVSLVSVYAIVQGFGYYPFYIAIWDRPYSSIGSPIPMAALISMAIPLCFYLCSQNKWWAIALLPMGYAVILSKSIGASIGLVVACFFIWYVLFRNKWAGALILVCILALLLVGNQRVKDAGKESFRVRMVYWRAAVRMVGDNPTFGVGLGNMKNAYPYYRERVDKVSGYVDMIPTEAHNGYLDIAAKTGIPGLLIYLVLVGTVLRNLWINYFWGRNPLLICFMASIIGYLVQDLTGLFCMGLTPFFFIIMGVAINEKN